MKMKGDKIHHGVVWFEFEYLFSLSSFCVCVSPHNPFFVTDKQEGWKYFYKINYMCLCIYVCKR